MVAVAFCCLAAKTTKTQLTTLLKKEEQSI